MLSITDDAYLPITIPYSNRISLLYTVCFYLSDSGVNNQC